jgi:hypothetical protein
MAAILAAARLMKNSLRTPSNGLARLRASSKARRSWISSSTDFAASISRSTW